MKLKLSRALLPAVISLLMLASCESKTESSDTAFERARDDKEFYGENPSPGGASLGVKEPKQVMKAAPPANEWSQFKTGINNIIQMNEDNIKAIRKMKVPADKASKKILLLEESNNNLKRELAEYEAEEKERLEKFRLRLSEDAEAIRTELLSLKKNSEEKSPAKPL